MNPSAVRFAADRASGVPSGAGVVIVRFDRAESIISPVRASKSPRTTTRPFNVDAIRSSLRSTSSAGGISSDSNNLSNVAITFRTFVVVASTPEAAASSRSIQRGSASSGMPFGGDSQNATINTA